VRRYTKHCLNTGILLVENYYVFSQKTALCVCFQYVIRGHLYKLIFKNHLAVNNRFFAFVYQENALYRGASCEYMFSICDSY
jgi:hypothetical protein